MQCVFVAGPYNSSDVIRVLGNMRRGMETCYRLIKYGMAPFCPWLDYHYALIGEMSVEEYRAYSIAWLRKADAVLLVEGWQNSPGTTKEIDIAVAMGIPVFTKEGELIEWAERQRKAVSTSSSTSTAENATAKLSRKLVEAIS